MKQQGFATVKRNKLIFAISFLALPILQVLIFYIYVNLNSFFTAFQKYDAVSDSYVFNGLNNFKDIFARFDPESPLYDLSLRNSLFNSLLMFVIGLIFGSLPAIIFSYYIFKKRFASGFFKIVLYVPHIISTVVFSMLYVNFFDTVIPDLIYKSTGELVEGWMADISKIDRVRVLCIVFTVFIGFGTNVLLYSGAMSGISESVIESGQLDGITPMKELFLVVLPLVWPTFVTFTVMSVIGIFSEQMSLYSLYREFAPTDLYTFGYYFYRSSLYASGNAYLDRYPFLASLGMLMTVIAVPLTLAVRKLLTKYGPSVE
jgi:ABC-type sugar transport system permease subunit